MGTSGNDIATIKYTSSGNQQWVERYPGQPSQFYTGRKITVDSQRKIFVIGDNSDSGTGSDYVTIKYSQLVGLEPVTSNVPIEFKLQQNYPNPFNPSTKIQFEIKKFGDIKIIVNDLLGKEIETIVNENLNSGIYEKSWYAGNYSSGVYFYTMFVDGKRIESKKMMLTK